MAQFLTVFFLHNQLHRGEGKLVAEEELLYDTISTEVDYFRQAQLCPERSFPHCYSLGGVLRCCHLHEHVLQPHPDVSSSPAPPREVWMLQGDQEPVVETRLCPMNCKRILLCKYL